MDTNEERLHYETMMRVYLLLDLVDDQDPLTILIEEEEEQAQ